MPKTLIWLIKSFKELDIDELYELLRLRAEVFVVEQEAAYQDLDNKDKVAIHLSGYQEGKLVAYCRIFKAGDYFEEASIGRVVVAAEYRKSGLGHLLMNKAIELEKTLFGETQITISAQFYLKSFYESHGFIQTGDMYSEDGIPHIRMKRK